MLLVLRSTLTLVLSIAICVLGSIYCLHAPCNPKNSAVFGRLFGQLHRILGITLEIRELKGPKSYRNAIYIANHQNNYDMITVANIIQPNTVTVGKKGLLLIPFFGLLYWLSGNLMIDRQNHIRSSRTMKNLVELLRDRYTSFWVFPEGTRSRGRGLLPFKTGAFRAAIEAQVPIVPIVASNTHNKISLNRLRNGVVIVEMMPPIETKGLDVTSARELAYHCHAIMKDRIYELNKEVTDQENITHD